MAEVAERRVPRKAIDELVRHFGKEQQPAAEIIIPLQGSASLEAQLVPLTFHTAA